VKLPEAAALAVAVLTLAGCDKVYSARIDVGRAATSQVTVSSLSPAERERAVSIFRATAHELGLYCSPTKYPITTDSYDRSRYQFSRCLAARHPLVQLAEASDHVAVEVLLITGGLGEPAHFKKVRTRFAESLQAAFPSGRVTVQYPYQWERDAQSRHKDVGGRPSNNALQLTRPAQAMGPRS
jgi:hypothetical protein